jgi:hypothetical protein
LCYIDGDWVPTVLLQLLLMMWMMLMMLPMTLLLLLLALMRRLFVVADYDAITFGLDTL